MHSPWSRAVVDPERVKPRANSGLSFTEAHILDSQQTPTTSNVVDTSSTNIVSNPTPTRSHSLPLISVTPSHPSINSSSWEIHRSASVAEISTDTAPTSSVLSSQDNTISQAYSPFGDWLSYKHHGLAVVTEEPAELNEAAKSEAAAVESIEKEIGANNKPPNMSYVYPTPLDQYDRGHYQPSNGSIASDYSLSGHDLSPADTPHDQSLSPLDASAPPFALNHEFQPSSVINALNSGVSGTSSPMSAKEQELLRQRRRTHNNIRRQSKTKLRRQRSTTDTSYLPRSVNQDYSHGLGIQYSSAPAIAAPITSQPVGGSQYFEQLDESMSPTAHSVYGAEYYGPPVEFGLEGYSMGYGMPASSESPQALYAPYSVVPSLPSISVPAPHHVQTAMYEHMNGRGLSNSPGADDQVRVITARPKPQCWDHGCNGRQFSTFSNLLRHQREKSGTATKSYCPKCGAEFTRTTARNGHMAHEKCKSRSES
ncbi:MAG: hypothetical protein M1814_000891 [Vezdaea aestivalis]|nr:MAG: hypothetical protein M1814_000891 [Vezdaea aestivalis]